MGKRDKNSPNQVRSIGLDKLCEHPDNPNKMNKSSFAKLVRNIEQGGRYEPLVVRPAPGGGDGFELINGHHRRKALEKLGYERADCVVWDVDDEEVDVLLMSLNRLGGSDDIDRKSLLIKRLRRQLGGVKLAKLLPQTVGQIDKLASLKRVPTVGKTGVKSSLANPLVFFVDDGQQKVILDAIVSAQTAGPIETKAKKRACALTRMAEYFLDNSRKNSQKTNKIA